MLETPSRIWRRIEAVEAHNDDMPSLPSLPALDDSVSFHESDQSDSDSHNPSMFPSLAKSRSPPRPLNANTLHGNSHRALPASSHHEDTHVEQNLKSPKLNDENRTTFPLNIEASNESDLIANLSTSEDAQVYLNDSDYALDRQISRPSLSDILEESDMIEESISSSAEDVVMASGPNSGSASASTEENEYSISVRSETKHLSKPNIRNSSFRNPSFKTQTAPMLSLSASSGSSVTSHPTPKSSSSGQLPVLPRSPSAQPFFRSYSENNIQSEHFANMPTSTTENEDDMDLNQEFTKLSETSSTGDIESDGESFQNAPLLDVPLAQSISGPDELSDLLYDHTTEDSATPHARRRSFLLSVINSTSRPRMILPTSHHKAGQTDPLHAFAGATPGPRASRRAMSNIAASAKPRLSHPLSQAHTFDPVTPIANNRSPDDLKNPSGSNASFISTASSHDLVMYGRANASFDPIAGLQGVNRFNTGKLNIYLHGLNRRLQEENEALVTSLKAQQEENMRLRANGHGGLEDLREDIGAENWLQERDLLERQIDGLKAEVKVRCEENEALKEQLEKERNDRVRDKERWKNKMIEVEEGVGSIVKDLEDKLAEAERKSKNLEESEHLIEDLKHEIDLLKTENSTVREKADLIAESERALDTELKAAQERITLLQSEVQEMVKKFERFNTPSKFIQQSGISPIHRQVLSIVMKTPKTPGGPLRDMSWLRDSTVNVSTSSLLAEVDRLQEALDIANADIDDKLNKLEIAGLGNEYDVIIEHLRKERSALTEEYSELQKRFTSATEQLHDLQRKHDALQVSHDDRRNECDRLAVEIKDIKTTLTQKATDLKTVQDEKQNILSERNAIKRSVASLEADLRRVRQDAEVFGRDLKHLREERDRLEAKHREEITKNDRFSKESSMAIRLLKEELNEQKEKTQQAMVQLSDHFCQPDNERLEILKLQHKKECKGLIVQIHYLKYRFTRESSFRADLSYQKDYLLLLLSKHERSEKRILATIAQIGVPKAANPQPPQRMSFKTIGLLVLFITRVRRVSTAWHEQRATKQAIMDALHEVRKRRAITS